MFVQLFSPCFIPSLVYSLLNEKEGDVVDLKQYGRIRDSNKKNAQGERNRERDSCSEKERDEQIERAIVYNLRTSGSPLRHLCQLIGHSY